MGLDDGFAIWIDVDGYGLIRQNREYQRIEELVEVLYYPFCMTSFIGMIGHRDVD